ncbi:hypothetical protein [Vibrio splendidus]|uniref:hypothetical protein n=1 Tax=Vibrio splendidus TaxID=29497 RepID=UPI000C84FE15|nr:hypothetical protein [Vibrio splendidus]PMK15876.1 hypothetical protein BCU10_13870 [Vibrio splendidus]
MTIKTELLSLVQEKTKQTTDVPELQDFLGYLVGQLNAMSESELEEYQANTETALDVLRLVACQSVSINVEYRESFTDKVIREFT